LIIICSSEKNKATVGLPWLLQILGIQKEFSNGVSVPRYSSVPTSVAYNTLQKGHSNDLKKPILALICFYMLTDSITLFLNLGCNDARVHLLE